MRVYHDEEDFEYQGKTPKQVADSRFATAIACIIAGDILVIALIYWIAKTF